MIKQTRIPAANCVYCFTGELTPDDICYIYTLYSFPFLKYTFTSNRSLHWDWGHISANAEGNLGALPGRLGNKDTCSLSKSWSCQRCTHGLDSDLILGCWGRAMAVFPVRLWHHCVPEAPMGTEQCLIEALTRNCICETQHTW